MDQLFPLVLEITNPEQRESALLELSKKREAFPDLAPILWHSFGTISALLQEIVSIYPLLSPPALTAHASNRVCNALALLQCVASHTETRTLFLNGVCIAPPSPPTELLPPPHPRRSLLSPFCTHCCSDRRPPPHAPRRRAAHIPLYLYPFLNTVSKNRPFEYLRLTSLGVIGALVKVRRGWRRYRCKHCLGTGWLTPPGRLALAHVYLAFFTAHVHTCADG